MFYNWKLFPLFLVFSAIGCGSSNEPPDKNTDGTPWWALSGGPGGSILPPVVYNVLFTNKDLSKKNSFPEKIVFAEDIEAEVRFSLGPRDPSSALDPREAAISESLWAEILDQNADLVISMVCRVCKDRKIQSQRIRWDMKKRRSGQAIFSFTPVKNAETYWGIAAGNILFSVEKDGNRFDSVVVPIDVAGEELQVPIIRRSPGPGALSRALDKERQVDVTLNVSIKNEIVHLSVIPNNQELKIKFPPQQFYMRELQTGLTKTNLRNSVENRYARIQAVLDAKNEESRKEFSKTSSPTKQAKETVFGISSEEYKKIEDELGQLGVSLYGLLFSGPELEKLWSIVEEYASSREEPVKIGVQTPTGSAHLPWQLLNDSFGKPIDVKKFWGIRYEVSITPIPLSQELPGEMFSPLKSFTGVFAGWGDKQSDGQVFQNSKDQYNHLVEGIYAQTSDLSHTNKITFSVTSMSFMEMLQAHADKTNIIWAYLHGTSGGHIGPSGQVSSSLLGPSLLFSEHDELPAIDLQGKLDPRIIGLKTGIPFVSLSQRPIVFLNGCETGTAGLWAGKFQTFPDVFLLRGARAVIASETSIGQDWGLEFGNKIIDDLISGMRLSQALLKERRYYIEKEGNPMGLLFSYYGSPAVRLKVRLLL